MFHQTEDVRRPRSTKMSYSWEVRAMGTNFWRNTFSSWPPPLFPPPLFRLFLSLSLSLSYSLSFLPLSLSLRPSFSSAPETCSYPENQIVFGGNSLVISPFFTSAITLCSNGNRHALSYTTIKYFDNRWFGFYGVWQRLLRLSHLRRSCLSLMSDLWPSLESLRLHLGTFGRMHNTQVDRDARETTCTNRSHTSTRD